MEENTTSGGLDRRTIIKGAAWSLPVVAVAAAVPAMAASTGTDLTGAFSGPLNLSLVVVVPVATVSTVTTLTITNDGPEPQAAGATVRIQYNPALLTLNIAQVGGITVLGSDGDYTVTLPAIPVNGSVTIQLGTLLDSLLTLSLLTQILGGGPEQITATIAGDTVTGNNVVVSPIGIQLL